MGRSTVHYADNTTNNILKRLHNKLRPAGTPVERVEYIIELLLLRIFETKLKQDEIFYPLRKLFEGENYRLLFSYLQSLSGDQVLSELNKNFFPYYANILTKSREVVKENLHQKMLDQLVLMEEVFVNSNFTNNVKGGVLAEVIGLINEIEEKWILKTDLLGDAIESALSETGGTSELQLYRTPDHIRKMMVKMCAPTFEDTIFDPACGTAGFLFDAFEYVIQKAREKGSFPEIHVANQFYRTGISGIEYQGRIRKMAAVNMYIRGLNPQNISQGDSLQSYTPTDENSKSVILANPPFGAERDQPAYPNIWEDYSKESETTILFVKLMLDTLKEKGRCAVVVSEGFLTWGQASARALRKMLINDANLKAIISLPQGVFVSKKGQGAKTSILYFEKGKPTNSVWFYKIENDGYSMGTNRKEIEGNNIPELLELFEQVKNGEKPQDTERSFCIPKDWIETLDPRITDRIAKETREKEQAKGVIQREKKTAQLDKMLANKKINNLQYQARLEQFEETLKNKIENLVAKNIEKAHTYHFNLQNYRSSLSPEQVSKWQELFQNIETANSLTLRQKWRILQKANLETATAHLATFNPLNVVHVDIARDYLQNLESEELNESPILKQLDDIFKSENVYKIVKLGKYLKLNKTKFKPLKFPNTIFTVLGVSNEKGIFVNGKLQGTDIKQSYFRVSPSEFCYNPYRINVSSIGLNNFDFDEQIISGAYVVFSCREDKLDPLFLDTLLKTKSFLDYVNDTASGGVRMNFKYEILEDWQIPLPPPEKQKEIVDKIKHQQQIIKSADVILNEWEVDIPESQTKKELSEFIVDTLYGISTKLKDIGKYPVIRMNNLDTKGNWILHDLKYINDEIPSVRKLKIGDFIFNRTNSIELVGKSAVVNFDFDGTWAGYLIRVRLDNRLSPHYLKYLFTKKKYRNHFSNIAKPAGGQANINAKELSDTLIDYFPPETQKEIVAKLDAQMEALKGVRLLKETAQTCIDEILASLWQN